MSLITRLLRAGDTGDHAEFHAVLDAAVVVHAPAGLSTQGAQAEWASWEKARTAMPGLTHTVIDVLTTPSLEAARVEVSGLFDGAYGGLVAHGRPFRIDQAVFARVEGGRIVELWEIVDVAALRDQVESDS